MLRITVAALALTLAACADDPTASPSDLAPEAEVATDTGHLWDGVDIATTAWTGVATWTVWTSDNLPPVTCPVGSLVTGFECRGSYCDDLRLKCQPQSGHTLTSRTWTSYFSEEGTSSRTCTGFLSGLSCTGGYCDNLSMECTRSTRTATSCVWSAWFSDGDPAFQAPTGHFVRSLQCSGSSCDNVRAEYCRD